MNVQYKYIHNSVFTTDDKVEAKTNNSASTSMFENYLRKQDELGRSQKPRVKVESCLKDRSLEKRRNFFDKQDANQYKAAESSSFTQLRGRKRKRHSAPAHNFTEDGDVISDIEVNTSMEFYIDCEIGT